MAADVVAGGPIGRFLADQLDSTYEDAVPLRFLGGVHRLVLAGQAPELAARFPSVGGDGDAAAAWPALLAALDAHADAIRDALDQAAADERGGRSAALVGGFLVVARDTGPAAAGARGRLAAPGSISASTATGTSRTGPGTATRRHRCASPTCGTEGHPPFDAAVTIAERRGCDRDPIDAGTEDGRLTLLSYVWPGQTERFTMLRAALDVARDVPIRDRPGRHPGLARGASSTSPYPTAPPSCSTRSCGSTSRTTSAPRPRRRWPTAGDRATSDAPLAWLRLEPSPDLTHTELRVTAWPGGEDRLLARGHYHLGPVQWVA